MVLIRCRAPSPNPHHADQPCRGRVVRLAYPVKVRPLEREEDADPRAHLGWCKECGTAHELLPRRVEELQKMAVG